MAWGVGMGMGGLRLRGRMGAMRGAAGPAQDGRRKGRYGLGLVLVLAGAMDHWKHGLRACQTAFLHAHRQTGRRIPNRPGGLASRAGSVGRHETAAEEQRSP